MSLLNLLCFSNLILHWKKAIEFSCCEDLRNSSSTLRLMCGLTYTIFFITSLVNASFTPIYLNYSFPRSLCQALSRTSKFADRVWIRFLRHFYIWIIIRNISLSLTTNWKLVVMYHLNVSFARFIIALLRVATENVTFLLILPTYVV